MHGNGTRAIQLEIVVLHGDVPAPADESTLIAIDECVIPNRPPAHLTARQQGEREGRGGRMKYDT